MDFFLYIKPLVFNLPEKWFDLNDLRSLPHATLQEKKRSSNTNGQCTQKHPAMGCTDYEGLHKYRGHPVGVVGHQNQEDQGQTNDKGAFMMTLMSKSQ